MNQDLLWRRIASNEQQVAERDNLVRPGENYRLTGSQNHALVELEGWFRGGARSAMLVAPTGAGKTAVEFRTAVSEFLARQAPIVVLVPTRDMVRQHLAYFRARLQGTPLRVEEMHGGVAPAERKAIMQSFEQRVVPIIIASGLLLKEENYRHALRTAGFIIVDDVNAFDPQEHLRPLRGIHTPMLFASATPQAVEEFLRFKDAYAHVTNLDATPFETPPTDVKVVTVRFGMDPVRQVHMADTAIRTHIENDGRIFIISRTRADVPRMARAMEQTYDVPVTMLHGEMVDTREQAQRLKQFKNFRPDHTRVAMMERFRETLPAMLVGTNLLGSGLDIPDADLIVVTDADGFGEAELEQLIGRVGRRERPSEAFLIKGSMQKRTKRGR